MVRRVLAAIPARWGSTRLPGKPLLLLDGKPMIAHVIRAAQNAVGITDVLVATDHDEIAQVVCRCVHTAAYGLDQAPHPLSVPRRATQVASNAGALAVMTDSALPSGTDRIAAALQLSNIPADLVVNIQGDEPLLHPGAISQVAELLLAHPDAEMSTLSAPLTRGDLHDPNKVKVVSRSFGALDPNQVKVVSRSFGALARDTASGVPREGGAEGEAALALYFSRAPIGVERDAIAHLLTPPSHSDETCDETSSGGGESSESQRKKKSRPRGGAASKASWGCRLHLGVYGYRREALERLVALPPSALEQLEMLEQLRALEAGYRIVVGRVEHAAGGVDTEADLARAREALTRR